MTSDTFTTAVHAKAVHLTREILRMTVEAGSGHATSAAGLVHLVTVLLYRHMRYDPGRPDLPDGDRLVLSEGHACPVVYAAAADLNMAVGKSPRQRQPLYPYDLLSLRRLDSVLDGHPNPREGFPFFPVATGSLGQGLSMAAGLGLAAKLDGSQQRIFCIVGDGESREGQIWEAIDFLLDYRLSNVLPIFNCNGFGQSDPVSPQQSAERLSQRLRGQGMEALQVDGHVPRQILEGLEQAWSRSERGPVALIARTVKAWGTPSLQGGERHGKPPSKSEAEEAQAELSKTALELGATGNGVLPEALPRPSTRERTRFQNLDVDLPTFEEAMQRFGKEQQLQLPGFAPRKAYGVALRMLGELCPQVVALDGDVKNSTYSEEFLENEDLKRRFFECRIAEQNMVSCAGGLAAAGWLPFVSTFGKFLVRAYDQFEMNQIGRLNVKYVGSHSGISLAADGPSQMALADVAFLRAHSTPRRENGMPSFAIFNPSDAYSAYALTMRMASHPGPCYLRCFRPDAPFLHRSIELARFTEADSRVLIDGSDVLLVATGYMVHTCVEAARLLRERGVEPAVLDLYALPFNADELLQLAHRCKGRVVTVEDTYGNSFGAAVAEALCATGNGYLLRQLYVTHTPRSGRTPEAVLEDAGLSPHHICSVASELAAKPAPLAHA